jgi:hypothetical protein
MDRAERPGDQESFFVFLECAEQSCESRVTLLALGTAGKQMGASGMEIESRWHNHSARCANGHPPLVPLKLLGWQLDLPEPGA